MNRLTRAGLSLILAAVLSVLLCIPSFADENTGLSPEQEPAAEAAATPAVTETVSPPVIIQEIQDEDYGTVEPEVIAANTPEMTGTFDDLYTPGPEETEALPGEVSAAVTPAVENTEEETEPEAEPAQAEPETEEEVPVNGEDGSGEETAEEEPSGQEEPVTDAGEEEEPAADEEAGPGETAEEPAGDAGTEETAAEEEPDGEEAEPAQAEEVRVTVSVVITMVDDNVMLLNAVINDPEGRNYEYQWQVSEDGGKTYSDIPEAKEDKLQIELTDENLGYMWRVWVRAV